MTIVIPEVKDDDVPLDVQVFENDIQSWDDCGDELLGGDSWNGVAIDKENACGTWLGIAHGVRRIARHLRAGRRLQGARADRVRDALVPVVGAPDDQWHDDGHLGLSLSSVSLPPPPGAGRLTPMHLHDASTEVLTQAIVRYAVDRVRMEPPLDGPRTLADLQAMAGNTITERGLGGLEALRVFGDVLAPACISVDHPRFLSFVPAAPTEASILFDLVVGASSIYGGSWMEGGGAVFAENEALRYIAGLAGMPAASGGVFVSGGTAGNLSALIAARYRWRQRGRGQLRPHPRPDHLLQGRAQQHRPGLPGDGHRRGVGHLRRRGPPARGEPARGSRRALAQRP